ncbi:hypothetical protein TWF481_008707 [Arthrobotrys musiformis]|uniref:N-acetyltransferase domain-containing protein n=1 Tax=Arthrobotrys musiformis TaxID=47236 RepID=A0AAV9W7Z3_9PEZI
MASYRSEYHSSILDPNTVVIVVEDTLNPNEGSKAYPALSKAYHEGIEPSLTSDQQQVIGQDLRKVIVGVASLTFQDGSNRRGQFQPEIGAPEYHPIGDANNRGRDTSAEGGRRYAQATSGPKQRILRGHMKVATIAVHPAYWQKSHASKIMDWIVALADTDNQPLVVSAAKMGVRVFQKYNFRMVENVVVPGYDRHPSDINLWMGRREVAGRAAL